MKRVVQLLNEMVRDGVIPNYAIGGAIGAVFYVEPFATQDIDVFVLMETEPGGLVTAVPITRLNYQPTWVRNKMGGV